MTRQLSIGEQTVKLCGNGATAIRYKQVFNRDLLVSFAAMEKGVYDLDLIKELAFVMAMQADGKSFTAITYEDFIEWLEQFEESDLIASMPDIISVWMNNAETKVKSKKK